MRRWIVICSALALLLTLTSCSDDTTKRISEAHTHAKELESQINDLKGKIDNLKNEVDRFNDTNWREVVPEVRDGVSGVQRDSAELADKAQTLTSALESLESDTEDNSVE